MKYQLGSAGSLCLVVVFFAGGLAVAQQSPSAPACGKAKVTLEHPAYLTNSLGIIAAEPPPGWVLDKSRKQPFYFFKGGENYESAQTLMYINVERLEVPFRQAGQNDVKSFQSSCQQGTVKEQAKAEMLECGCEAITQLFSCNRRSKGYVDLVTKISIGGLLVNVVLSGETKDEIDKYRNDYRFLLNHVTLVR